MKADNTIPILVGVTGHRSIKKEDYNAIYTSVKAELGKLQDRCPNSHIVLLTSLAEGGDLLCAEAATELDIPLVAVLPDELEIYEKDFSTEAKERLRFHCERAEQLFTAPFTEKVPENGISRAYRFRQAGIYVAAGESDAKNQSPGRYFGDFSKSRREDFGCRHSIGETAFI